MYQSVVVIQVGVWILDTWALCIDIVCCVRNGGNFFIAELLVMVVIVFVILKFTLQFCLL